MSCENKANVISRRLGQVSAGISALAGKRSFYAGMAVGAGGTAGGLALLNYLRQRRGRPGTALPPSANPRPLPKGDGPARKGTRTNPRPIPRPSKKRPRSIPALESAPVPTKLQAATIRLQTGGGQTITPEGSYRVVRPDGSDTGLAVTPFVGSGEDGQPVGDSNAWGVSHARTGSLIGGPYGSISEAQQLAGKLARLRWKGTTVPAADVKRARQIVEDHSDGL